MSDKIDFKEFGLEPPIENAEDIIRKLISAGQKIFAPQASIIDLLGQFITPQLERSRREWEFQVFCALKELNKRQEGILERLIEDPEFQSLLRQAFVISWKTHKEEKFKSLKAGLMNTALNSSISFDNKEIYFRLIDELTNTHLLLLNFIQEFRSRITKMDSFEKYYNLLKSGKIDRTLPVLDTTIELTTFRALMKELENKGLILISTEMKEIDGVKRRGRGLLIGNESEDNDSLPFVTITNHGLDFLTFLKEPN